MVIRKESLLLRGGGPLEKTHYLQKIGFKLCYLLKFRRNQKEHHLPFSFQINCFSHKTFLAGIVTHPLIILQTELTAKEGGLVLIVQDEGARVEPPLALVAPQEERLLRQGDRRDVELGLEGDDAVVAAEVAQGAITHGQVV